MESVRAFQCEETCRLRRLQANVVPGTLGARRSRARPCTLAFADVVDSKYVGGVGVFTRETYVPEDTPEID